MNCKQDDTSSYKITISHYVTYQERQTLKPMYYQGKIKWILQKITRMFNYSRKKCEQGRSQQQK